VGEDLLPGNVGRDIARMKGIERGEEQAAVRRDHGKRGEFFCVAIHGNPLHAMYLTYPVMFQQTVCDVRARSAKTDCKNAHSGLLFL